MEILIVSATSLEIEPFKRRCATMQLPGVNFHWLVTGVGQVQTSYNLLKTLSTGTYDFVLAGGVAGTFDPEVPLGAVLQVRSEVFADLGVSEAGTWSDIFDLKLAESDRFPFTRGTLQNPALPFSIAAPAAKGCTVNEVSTNPQRIAAILRRYSPLVESMEGGSIHYVCIRENLPFLHLRSVSNIVGERDKKNWDMESAIRNLSTTMEEAVKLLANSR